MPRSSKPSATLSAISKSERSNSLVSSLASSWGQFAVSIQNLHERRPIVLVLRPRPRKLAFALSTTKARPARSSIVKVTHRRNVISRNAPFQHAAIRSRRIAFGIGVKPQLLRRPRDKNLPDTCPQNRLHPPGPRTRPLTPRSRKTLVRMPIREEICSS